MELQLSTTILKQLTSNMATSDIRYYINGMHVQADEDGNTRVQTTDGHRLSVLTDGAFDRDQVVASEIIPAQIIKHILIGSRKRDAHNISVVDGVVSATNGSLKLTQNCVDGNYVATDSIINATRELKTQITLDSLKTIVSNIKYKGLKGLIIRFYDANDGDFTIEVYKVETVDGQRIGSILYRREFGVDNPLGKSVCLQLTNLIDLFKNTDRSRVAVHVSEGDNTVLFTSERDAVRSYIAQARTPDHWRESSNIYIHTNKR